MCRVVDNELPTEKEGGLLRLKPDMRRSPYLAFPLIEISRIDEEATIRQLRLRHVS